MSNPPTERDFFLAILAVQFWGRNTKFNSLRVCFWASRP
jgi:hypothetical protein